MFITGIGTAVPTKRYQQKECFEALQNSFYFAHLTLRSRAILKKVLLGNNGISTRHLALDKLEEAFEVTPDILHARFVQNAPQLATQAAQRALANSGKTAAEMDAVIVSTCTGYLCPGLTSYVSEQLGLRKNVFALDLVGQGCGAALPNLRTAESLIASGNHKNVLSICVEVCSAAFYLDDDPGVLISACLFGDGAGAAVLSNEPGSRAIKWIGTDSVMSTGDRDLLRFETRNGLLRNILSPEVPDVAAQHASVVLESLLQKTNHRKDEITSWIFHAGGRDVLLALQKKLELDAGFLCWSSRVLNDYGNLSSPFVYFVLDLALKEDAPPGLWWLASFGAGFSSHGALLEVS
ncbi:MAG: stilbene synthase [Verrucomicrobia bacterium]|nr:stilbene synthase [Verrucomicrobiota bacterium]